MGDSTPKPLKREVLLDIPPFPQYLAVDQAYHQRGSKQYLALRKVPAGTLSRPTATRNPRPFEVFGRERWRRTWGRIPEKPPNPELVDGVLVVRAGVPRFRVHVRVDRWGNDHLAPGHGPSLGYLNLPHPPSE